MDGESQEQERERRIRDVLSVMKGETTHEGVFQKYLRQLEGQSSPSTIAKDTRAKTRLVTDHLPKSKKNNGDFF